MEESMRFLPPERQEWSFSVKTTCEPAAHDRDSDGLQWHCEQVEPSLFRGHLTRLKIGSLHITKELTNLPLKYHGRDQVGSLLFHSASQTNSNMNYRGQAVEADTLVVLPGRVLEYGSKSGPLDCTFVSIDETYLSACSQHLLGRTQPLEFLEWGRSIDEPSIVGKYRRTINDVFAELSFNPDAIEDVDYRKAVAESVIGVLLEVLDVHAPKGSELRPSTRAYVVEKAIEYIDSNLAGPISIADLCRVARVSRRTLSYSFEEILGVSPARYLLTARLSRVHRELLALENKRHISYVAHANGFNHLGRFAKYYQQTYGKLPSETCGLAK